MTVPSAQRFKIVLGLILGLAIGAICRVANIPSPAPSVMTGALLVVAMTLGYAGCDRWLCRDPARQRGNCGGPDGSVRGD
ncbi:DUF1427 family protein [Variovorax sp. GT1P44]|uniref:DUF1427 family protein n=1 Tax=Variovorax sp. GT1P44 TaxID=3443742 RepID=UPI003F46308E